MSSEGQLADNLATIAELEQRELRATSRHQRAVEALAGAIARPVTIYILLAFCGCWVAYNSLPDLFPHPFDPVPFPILQALIAVYAAAVATAVLIAQSRQRSEADRRATLDLHLNLVSEQKVTKIISLLEELRRDLPNVRDRVDVLAEELQHEMDPRAVHSALKQPNDVGVPKPSE